MLETEQAELSDVQHQDILGKHWLTAAMHAHTLKQPSLAKQYAELAFNVYTGLNDTFPENNNYLAFLSESQLAKAKALQLLNQPEASIPLCQQVRTTLAKLTTNNKDPRYLISYSQALDCLGELPQHTELLHLLQQNAIINIYFNPTP